ncbi:GNAT family N-acetyltransferase [Kribbella jiaozuonensis]|uniref:GNAT family N-acetyltransferase n=1 Tax=Kribbella jiaozuonensis TaxID=2575441 RepID=A0A4U3LLC7_9ACTN|nr:GNAT family N-acetyltransferase [Kribbella jiaozuonensis]TKK75939.1 GNAT family N-acetyltransferase [Kribbella jiaozuonensis]
MDITSLGYRTDLLLLELGGSIFRDTGEYVVVRTPANPGFWWGNFLLYRTPFAPDDAKIRVDDFRREFPDAEHVALGIDSVDGEIGAEDEVKAAGLTIDRSVVMTADRVVPPPRPNTESTYRFLDSDDDWAQLFNLSLATADMTVDAAYEDFTRRKQATQRELVAAGHGKWFGAFEGDRLQSSMGLMFDGKGVARFQTVQTSPEDRGRGLAGTLVHHVSTYGLTEGGARTLVMVADPDYLAVRIYRSVGFEDTETQLQFARPPA